MRVRFFCLIPFFLIIVLGQLDGQYSIKGLVKDSLSESPLAYANVILKTSNDSILLAYDVADRDGRFELICPSDTVQVDLHISFIGYRDRVLRVDKRISEIDLQVFLCQSSQSIEEIEIKAFKRGVIVNGDTTTYDKSVFTSGHEDNVSEVLNKLPGIQIEQDGKILANGKEVIEILIDGDDFLSENRNAILKGLSASDVSNISIIENYKGEFHEDTATALDIRLNNDKSDKISGRIELSKGVNNKYQGRASPYIISPKRKLYFSINSSNTGAYRLGINDYVFLNGNKIENTQDIPQIFRDHNNYESLASDYVSGNFSIKPSNFVSYKGFAFINSSRAVSLSSSQRFSENSEFNFAYRRQVKQSTPFYGGVIKMTVDPEDDIQITAGVRVTHENGENAVSDSTTINGFRFNTIQDKYIKRQRIIADVGYHHLLGKSSRFDLAASYGYLTQEDIIDISSDSGVLPVVSEVFGKDLYNVNQQFLVGSHDLKLRAQYTIWEEIWEYSISANHQYKDSRLLLSHLRDRVRQSIDLNQSSLHQEFRLSLSDSELIIDIPIERFELSSEPFSRNYLRVAGTLTYERRLSPMSLFSLSYKRSNSSLNLKEPLNQKYLKSAYDLRENRYDPLRILSYHMGKMSLRYQNPESGLFINTHFRVIRNELPIIENNYEERYSKFLVADFTYRSAMDLGVFFSKKIINLPFGYRGYAFWRRNQHPRVFNDIEFMQRSDTFFGELTGYTSMDGLINTEFSVKINQSSFDALESDVSTLSSNSSLTILLGKSEWSCDFSMGYERIAQVQGSEQNLIHNVFGNISLFHGASKRLATTLTFNNLLHLDNVKNINSGIVDGQYYVSHSVDLSGYIVAGLSYRL